MFVVDFETKGNVIRLAYGHDKDYWGDDWNDFPFEHNAGSVYERYVDEYREYAFPMNFNVCNPADDWNYQGNSHYSKEDFKKQKAPCVIIHNLKDSWGEPYSRLLGSKSEDVLPIYFGTDMIEIHDAIMNFGGYCIWTDDRR